MEQEKKDNNKNSACNTKRIAKNTLMLYFRQILIMLVSLYTVRVILNTLGAEDYGIYNVVAGVVTMFGFLSGAMATASQRFFSFELGKCNYKKLKKTFSVTLCIYLLLILIIVILAETVGLWFVNYKLVIPPERMTAARWIYQFSILSFAVTLVTTPYMAAIIAHENMNVYAYVSIVEAGLKLGIVFLLKILPYDKLIIYGILLFAVSFINTALYRAYCKKHYKECVFKPVWDKDIFREIWGYNIWNLFGSVAYIFQTQGVGVVLNQFYGPIVNSARAIAFSVNTAVVSFSQNFSTAIQPQIVKNYAKKDYNGAFNLVFRGCRMTHFLMLIFVVPLILNMEFVLSLWLKIVPNNALVFTKLVLISTLIKTLSFPMASLNQATGKIKYYQMLIGITATLAFPVSYLLLKNGLPAYTVYFSDITIETILVIIRMLFLYQIKGFSVLSMLKKVFLPLIIVDSVVIVIFTFWKLTTNSFATFFMNVIFEVLVTLFFICFIGLTQSERKSLIKIIKMKIRRNK